MAKFVSELDEEDESSAKGLRAQLEQALSTNRQLADENSTMKTEKVLTAKGFSLVKPEDLKGVAAADVEAKAKTIQEEREKLQSDLLRAALQSRGIEGDDLEDMLSEMVTTSPEDETVEATKRVRSLSGVESRPAPRVDMTKLHGEQAIEAALAAADRKKSRSGRP